MGDGFSDMQVIDVEALVGKLPGDIVEIPMLMSSLLYPIGIVTDKSFHLRMDKMSDLVSAQNLISIIPI